MDTKKLLERIRWDMRTRVTLSRHDREVLSLCEQTENLLREIEDLRQHVLEMAK